MRIEHIAIWVRDIEKVKDFYCSYFDGVAGEKYVKPKKQFQSYFIQFENGSRLELMQMLSIPGDQSDLTTQRMGLIHFAISTGSIEHVDDLTNRLVRDGFQLLDGPRWTGDGYYESVILDPENNRVEITV